jgi:hypothetical protein
MGSSPEASSLLEGGGFSYSPLTIVPMAGLL